MLQKGVFIWCIFGFKTNKMEESKKTTSQINNELQTQVVRLKDHIAKLEAINKELEECLNEVRDNYKSGHMVITAKIIDMTEQAINNPKQK